MTVADDSDFPGPRFDTLQDRSGLEIVDPVETVRFELWTPERVEPVSANPGSFAFPLDSAARILTDRIEIPRLADVFVRDETGAYVGQYSTATDREQFGPGRYNVELTTTPMKLYLLVESPLDITGTDSTSVVNFGAETTVRVGARSFHERPSGTITVTDDPEDLLDAVSLFGSALKDTSPERSFPTLRGHPPRVKHGKDFGVSKGIEPPETGVTLVVPPERRAVYAVAPLAFYLGADLVAGNWPRLLAGDVEREFPRPAKGVAWDREADGFERAVNRTLQQVFFLDCLTRTEGFYQFDLHERAAVETNLGRKFDLDLEYLYDRSIPTQLEAYFDVEYEDIAPYFPTWNLLVDVVPTTEQDELLPYVVNNLPLIRCTPPPEDRTPRPEDEYTTEILGLEGGDWKRVNADSPDVHDRSLEGHSFEPLSAPSIEHAYAGDGYPTGANKLTLKGFENQLGKPRSDKSSIKVQVVVNDPKLENLDLLSHVYNDRNLIDIDVSYDYLVRTGKLAKILEQDIDFFHFVGRVTEGGLGCTNGTMKPRMAYPLGVRSFFLSSCDSYGDAEWLINRGAYGGIVSVTEPKSVRRDDNALVMGRWIARALNHGFTLRSAAEVAQQANPGTLEYTILGDGGISLVQTEGIQPSSLEIRPVEDEVFLTSVQTYPSASKQIGSLSAMTLGDDETHYIVPKKQRPVKFTASELSDYLRMEPLPVKIENDYIWSDSFLETSIKDHLYP